MKAVANNPIARIELRFPNDPLNRLDANVLLAKTCPPLAARSRSSSAFFGLLSTPCPAAYNLANLYQLSRRLSCHHVPRGLQLVGVNQLFERKSTAADRSPPCTHKNPSDRRGW